MSRLSSVSWCSEVPKEASWGSPCGSPSLKVLLALGDRDSILPGGSQRDSCSRVRRGPVLPPGLWPCGRLTAWRRHLGTTRASIQHLAGCCPGVTSSGGRTGPDVSPASLSPAHLPLLSRLVPVLVLKARCVCSSCVPWPGQCFREAMLVDGSQHHSWEHQQQTGLLLKIGGE